MYIINNVLSFALVLRLINNQSMKCFKINTLFGKHKLQIVLLFSLFLLTNKTTLLAQNTFQQHLTIGTEGGIQFTNITNPGYPLPPKSIIKPIKIRRVF